MKLGGHLRLSFLLVRKSVPLGITLKDSHSCKDEQIKEYKMEQLSVFYFLWKLYDRKLHKQESSCTDLICSFLFVPLSLSTFSISLSYLFQPANAEKEERKNRW